MHKLLSAQVSKSALGESVDVATLLKLVDSYYDEIDRDRMRSERSMRLMIEEVDQLNAILQDNIDKLSLHNSQMQAILENMAQGVALFGDRGEVILCNTTFRETFRIAKPSDGCERTVEDLFTAWWSNAIFDPGAAETEITAARKAIKSDRPTSRTCATRDGRTLVLAYIPMPGDRFLMSVRDMSDIHRHEAELHALARQDGLTGLPNRLHFRELLEAQVARVKRGHSIALLCLDLDHFKRVNDTLGHPVGDALLRQVATRIRSLLRSNDHVARLGGDEFAIILTDCRKAPEAGNFADRLIPTLSAPYEIDGHHILIGASVGIAFAPDDGDDGDALMRNADMALYKSKGEGRGAWRCFEAAMNERMQERRAMETDLRAALDKKQFELHFQPVVDLRHDRITAFEALLRWTHPERGRVPPSDFIPIAEESGLINEIGSWVLRAACAEAATWPDNIGVSINVSPTQMRSSGLVLQVAAAINKAGLRPDRVELEITETVMMHDTELTLATLDKLRQLGVRISVDDFGTGYASIGYLRRFPIDKIKIDRSFVSDVQTRPDSLAILRAISGIGASLGIRTTAEGVETLGELNVVRTEGCSEVQGYYFSKPVPGADIPRLLGAWKARAA